MRLYGIDEVLLAMVVSLALAFGIAIALDDDSVHVSTLASTTVDPVKTVRFVDPYIEQLDTLLALSLNVEQKTTLESVLIEIEKATFKVAADDGLIDEFEFYEIIANTPWPVSQWGAVWEISSCESSQSGYGDVNPTAIGDLSLVPRTGPSLGAMQINIRAHPELHRTFDLLDITDNLTAGYVVWLKAGGSFTPWSCFKR